VAVTSLLAWSMSLLVFSTAELMVRNPAISDTGSG
jgi:hypothetical protein